MSETFEGFDYNKLEELYKLYTSNSKVRSGFTNYRGTKRKGKYPYNNFPNYPPKGGKSNDVNPFFTFLNENFGFNYGDIDKFKKFGPVFEKFINMKKKKKKTEKKTEEEEETVKETEEAATAAAATAAAATENPISKQIELYNKYLERNKKGELVRPVQIQRLINTFLRNKNKLSKEEIEFIKSNAKELAAAKYEADYHLVGKNLNQKLEKIKKKIKKLDYEIEFPKNELEKQKAIKLRNELKDKMKRLSESNNYKQLTGITNKDYEYKPAQLNSFIPKKQIPLFVKDIDGPGYHKITMEEINALKNDPSGDFYTGEGILGSKLFRKKVLEIVGKTGGSNYINTNYKPDFPTTPFSIGW